MPVYKHNAMNHTKLQPLWRWRPQNIPKRRKLFISLHHVTSHSTWIFSNGTFSYDCKAN